MAAKDSKMVKIFIGNLDEASDASKLRGMFEQYGEVRECDILSKYGFVHMDDERAAMSAIAALNGADLDGIQIDVKQSTSSSRGGRGGGGRDGGRDGGRGRGGGRGRDSGGRGGGGRGFGRTISARDMGPGPVKIFIGNMSEETKTEDLQALFEQYGEVTECAVLNRYGFVHMANPDDADSAIEALHHYKLHGFTINVELSHGKSKTRDDSGPRGGGRGGRGAGRGGRGSSRYDPYARDSYGSDPYDRSPLPPAYDRDPYARLPPIPPRDRDPYDPYRRDPYARDPYAREDPYRRARDPYLERDLYDPYRRDPYLYARAARDPYPPRERDPYPPRERDPYAATRERDPYARPPPAYYDYDTAARRPAEEPKYDPYSASRRAVTTIPTTDPYTQLSAIPAVTSNPYSNNGY